MKKLFLMAILSLCTMAFAKTIHVKKAYAMKKSQDGRTYVIRVLEKDGYHDWYVISTDKPWLFYGFEGDDEIIVDEIIDIAVIGY